MAVMLLGFGALYTFEAYAEIDQFPIYAWFFGVLARDELIGPRRLGGAAIALFSTLTWLAFALERQFFSFALPMAVIAGLAAVTLYGAAYSGKRPDKLQQLFY